MSTATLQREMMQLQATPGNLSAKQQRAILALLSEPGIDAAARKAGVNPATLWRWQRQPHFREALAEARRQAFSQATTRLAAVAAQAAEELYSIVRSPTAPPAARVSAARAILENARQTLELDDLAERLTAVEVLLAAQVGGKL